MRLHLCTVYMYTAQDVVQCVSQASRPPGRPCRESPGLFVLSLSHYVDRAAWVVSPASASPALLNVSAADEWQHSTEVLRLPLSELRRKLNPLVNVSAADEWQHSTEVLRAREATVSSR